MEQNNPEVPTTTPKVPETEPVIPERPGTPNEPLTMPPPEPMPTRPVEVPSIQ